MCVLLLFDCFVLNVFGTLPRDKSMWSLKDLAIALLALGLTLLRGGKTEG